MPTDAGIPLIFGTSLLVGFSGAAAPGPLLALTVAQSAKRGFWVGPVLALGHSLADLAAAIALAAGLSRAINTDIVGGIVGLVGGAFLLWMGYSMYRGASRGTWSLLGQGQKTSNVASPLLAGALVSATNPYWAVWWVTVGSGYIVTSLKHGVGGWTAFYTGHISSDLIWYSVVALLVAGGRKWLSDAFYRWTLVVCGVFLLAMGGYFIYAGVGFLV